jgi:hypothetical protein
MQTMQEEYCGNPFLSHKEGIEKPAISAASFMV